MSWGKLVVFATGRGQVTEVVWHDERAGAAEPSPHTVRWLVGGPMGRTEVMYEGVKRFAYYHQDMAQATLPLNARATGLVGSLVYGTFLINVPILTCRR